MRLLLLAFCSLFCLAGLIARIGLSAESASLASRLTSLAKAHKGKVAVAFKNLETGESFYLNADELLPTASLIKFPVLLELYQQACEGKINLSDKVMLKG